MLLLKYVLLFRQSTFLKLRGFFHMAASSLLGLTDTLWSSLSFFPQNSANFCCKGEAEHFLCRKRDKLRIVLKDLWLLPQLSYTVPVQYQLPKCAGKPLVRDQMHIGPCVWILGDSGWLWLTQASAECSEQNLTRLPSLCQSTGWGVGPG